MPRPRPAQAQLLFQTTPLFAHPQQGTDEVIARVETDADRRFLVRGLEPGAHDLSARLGARRSATRRVTVAEGRGAPVELALPDADGLTVRFQNARGEPLPLVIDNHGALIPLSLAVEMGLAKVVTAGTVVVDLRQ